MNLASAFGHPPEVMDMSFANLALAVKLMSEKGDNFENQVYKVLLKLTHGYKIKT